MKVIATQLGYYGDKRRKEGEVFILKNPKEFSKNWMKEVKANHASKKQVVEEPQDVETEVSESEVI